MNNSKKNLSLADLKVQQDEEERNPLKVINTVKEAAKRLSIELLTDWYPVASRNVSAAWDLGYRPIVAKDVQAGAIIIRSDQFMSKKEMDWVGKKIESITYDEFDDPQFTMTDGTVVDLFATDSMLANIDSIPEGYDFVKAYTNK